MSTPDFKHLDLCFIDIETTGSVFGRHEIIEIASIRTPPDASEVCGVWQKRAKPRFPERITPFAQELNGFSIEKWASEKPMSKEFWEEFNHFSRDCIPVCHNPSFERAFITLAMCEAGLGEPVVDFHWIGTESMAWPLLRSGLVTKPSLGTLCSFFGLEPEPMPHTALEGARTCWRVYRKLVGLWEAKLEIAMTRES